MFKIDTETLKKKLQKEAVELSPEEKAKVQTGMPQLDDNTIRRMTEREYEQVLSSIKKAEKSRTLNDVNVAISDGIPEVFRNMMFEGRMGADMKLSNHKFYSEVAEQVKSALHEATPPPFINLVVGNENMHFVKAFLEMALGSPYQDKDVSYLWTSPAARLLKSLKDHCKTPISYTPESKEGSDAQNLRKMIFGSGLAGVKLTEDFASRLMTTAFSDELLITHYESLREYKNDDNDAERQKLKNYPNDLMAEFFQLEVPDRAQETQFNEAISKDSILKVFVEGDSDHGKSEESSILIRGREKTIIARQYLIAAIKEYNLAKTKAENEKENAGVAE